MIKSWVGLVLVSGAIGFAGCVDSGGGSDFDFDGVEDEIEDPNDNFVFDPGESDFVFADTDTDGRCDGLASRDDLGCTGCEDCDGDGLFEPCATETDSLNDDTDNDGVRDGADPAPLDTFPVDCTGGGPGLAYGSSRPPGKPFPARPTPTPFPTLVPPTPIFATPTPTP